MNAPVKRTIIAGKYTLDRKLGQGSMGTVWAAEHLILRSQVAVKLIDPQIASDADALARFLREARAAASLRSPHVVQILDHGVDEGSPYIVMELLEGESLGERLQRRGALPAVEVAEILVQVARAVAKAHEMGIVHRDLKPDNIFIVHNDDADLAKVLDFGIAKETGANVGLSSPGTRSGALMGTPVYMSPEQAEGTKQVDFRSDLWSLGVIAYECLLGRRPFESEAIGSLVLDICTRPLPIPSRIGAAPPGFDAWFARACARDPAARFSSAKEQMHELRRILDGEHPSVRPGSRTRSSTPPPIVTESSSRPITATLVSTTDPLSSGPRQRLSAPPHARNVPLRVVILAAGAGAALLAIFFFYFARPGESKEAGAPPGVSALRAPEPSQRASDSRSITREVATVSPPSVPSASAAAPLPGTRSGTPPSHVPDKPVEVGRPATKRALTVERGAPATSAAPSATVSPSPAPTPTVNLGI
jgi:serine/threonine-protein kinase